MQREALTVNLIATQSVERIITVDMKVLLCCAGAVLSAALLLTAGESWSKKDRTQWSPAETQQILNDSAWSKRAQGYIGTTDEDPHTYLAKGPSARDIGLGGPQQDDWFPVGKLPSTRMPTLPVTVRWDSSRPVRAALLQSHAADARDTERSLGAAEKYYVLTVLGLAIPHKPGSSDADQDKFDETRLRQGLLNQSRLYVRNRPPLIPQDARVDQQTGSIQVFFPRDNPITLNDKEVMFGTIFGSVRVLQKFRLKEMVYQGELSL